MKIYVLKDDYFNSIEVFKDRSDRYHIQYLKKGEDKYSIKYGTIEELEGSYEYGDEIMNVSLMEKDIDI